MAEKIKSALPPDLDLGGGWTVEWDAVDPATGATVPGVIISKTSLLVPGDYGGGGGIEAATPYLLVPGPGDSSGLQFGGQVPTPQQPPPTDVVPPPPTGGTPPPVQGQPQPPSFTPTRTLPVARTWAEFQTALSHLVPGDRLPCKGVVIPGFAKITKLLSAPAEILFDATCKTSPGTKALAPCIAFENVANIRFMAGGMIVSNPTVGPGAEIVGSSHCVYDGWDVRNCASAALTAQPTVAPIVGNYIRATCRDWALVPSLDDHAEKGTGLHGLLCETSHTPHNAIDNTFVLSTPGSRMGGSLFEIGSSNRAMVPTNNRAWLQAANLLQDAKTQTAANALNVWGYLNGLDVLDVTADGLHGFAVHSAPWGFTGVRVHEGTATHCCLNPRYAGQNPFMTKGGIVYGSTVTPKP